MDEFELIRRFFTRRNQGAGVLVGIGDDGAVIRPAPERDLIAVLDTLIAGVHFPPDFPPRDIGYRALAVNLSDVAAMGGTPRWMLLALTLEEADPSWLSGFAEGLFEAARESGVALIGGDTTRGSQTVISVQVLGDVPAEGALTRSGAAPGDAIYVTGTVGDAAAGLAVLQGRGEVADRQDSSWLVARFSRPAARIGFGAAIAQVATAAIDLSDGLGTDLLKLLEASGIAGTLDLDTLPLSMQLRRSFDGSQVRHFAVDGGDDYELCFTARAADHDRVVEIAARSGVAVTRIGETTTGRGLTCTSGGTAVPYEDHGYRHF